MLLLALIIVFSLELKDCIFETIIECGSRLIPSIFPSMIIITVICNTKFSNDIGEKKYILGICKNRARIVFCSLLSGFILGPKILSETTQSGDETNYIALTTNAGIGYVVLFVGITMWNSILYGIFLYLIQIVSAIVFFNLQKKDCTDNGNITKSKPILKNITDSVQSSTRLMIDICGFTIFFAALNRIILCLFSLNQQGVVFAIITSILEITNGVQASTCIENNLISSFLCGFSVGFGGFCVIMQTIAVCKDCLKKTKLLIIKLLQGIICGFSSMVFVSAFGIEPKLDIKASISNDISIYNVIISSIFLFFVLILAKKCLTEKLSSI